MSEYLSEEEQMARMKSWWDENGTSLLVSLVVVIAGVGGWQWYSGHSAEQDFDAARAYAEYQSAEGADRDAAATSIASEYSGSAYHVFVLFDRAKTATETGELEEAADALENAVANAGDPLLADLAKIRLAKVQQGLDRSQLALDTLASIRSNGYLTLALEVQGDIHAAKGDMAAAHQAYEAAVASLAEGQVRPVLDMKLKNAAPFDGNYVPQTDSLATALEAAQETLDAAGVEALDGNAEDPAEGAEGSEGDDVGADQAATEGAAEGDEVGAEVQDE